MNLKHIRMLDAYKNLRELFLRKYNKNPNTSIYLCHLAKYGLVEEYSMDRGIRNDIISEIKSKIEYLPSWECYLVFTRQITSIDDGYYLIANKARLAWIESRIEYYDSLVWST